jgi:hypothetical protein
MGFDDPLDLDRMEKELLAEFAPTAFALTPSDGFHEIARANGYVKLEPGQVVVNESTHSLAMHMAAKWAEHVAGNDRGVTFIRTSNMEARDE